MTSEEFRQNQAFYIQYSGTPSQGHDDYLHGITSPEKPRPHINPNFRSTTVPGGQAIATTQPVASAAVHINPRFSQGPASNSGVGPVAGGGSIVINPNFLNQVSGQGQPVVVSRSKSHPSVPAARGGGGIGGGTGIHINPKFRPSPPASPRKPVNGEVATAALPKTTTTTTTVHVNPRFANRPLPSLPPGSQRPHSYHEPPMLRAAPAPHEPVYANVNPGVDAVINARKQQEFMASIQQSVAMRRPQYDSRPKPPAKPVRNSIIVEKSVDLNQFSAPTLSQPSATPSSTPAAQYQQEQQKLHQTPLAKIAEEKENLPSSNKRNFLFTPLRNTPFKKIGNRKLIRVKKNKSLSPATPKPSFKRIGNKKLIRIKDSLSASEKKTTPSSLKVYDIKTKTKLVKSVKNTPTNNSKYRFSFITPLSVRRKKTASSSSSPQHHTLSGKLKTSGGKKSVTRFSDRFKLDRRPKAKAASGQTVTDKCLGRKSNSQARLKKLGTSTYHVSATKLQKVASPCVKTAPARSRHFNIYRPKVTAVNPSIVPNKVITVQGVKFAVADNGRRLKRLASTASVASQQGKSTVASGAVRHSPHQFQYSASVSHATTTSPGEMSNSTSPGHIYSSPGNGSGGGGGGAATSPSKRPTVSPAGGRAAGSGYSPQQQQLVRAGSAHKKVYLGGEEFDEVEPGVFNRSRHSLTRQSITQAKNRSINIILKNQNRSKQYCMFYNKFGKCTKKDTGSCPFIHDQEKIAVCKRFLQGACLKETCLLSHKVAPEKMPACKYYLEGVCTKENCPYLHVKVSSSADICSSFLKGYCANGADCKSRHVIACPEFDRTGACSKDSKCPFPHIAKRGVRGSEESGARRKPPTKPKRKSLGQASDHNLKKSRVASSRYYQDSAVEMGDDVSVREEEDGVDETSAEALIRQAEELASAAWANQAGAAAAAGGGSAVGGGGGTTTDDSGNPDTACSSSSRMNQPGSSGGSAYGSVDDRALADNNRRQQDDLDASGPYERIEGDDDVSDQEEAAAAATAPRAAAQERPGRSAGGGSREVGQLGDFISLAGYSSDENEGAEDRLI